MVEREREGKERVVWMFVLGLEKIERVVALLIWVTIVVKKTPNFFSIFFTPVCVCGVCVKFLCVFVFGWGIFGLGLATQ